MTQAELERMLAQVLVEHVEMLTALRSIAANTCCAGCGEAAKVAAACLRTIEP